MQQTTTHATNVKCSTSKVQSTTGFCSVAESKEVANGLSKTREMPCGNLEAVQIATKEMDGPLVNDTKIWLHEIECMQ